MSEETSHTINPPFRGAIYFANRMFTSFEVVSPRGMKCRLSAHLAQRTAEKPTSKISKNRAGGRG